MKPVYTLHFKNQNEQRLATDFSSDRALTTQYRKMAWSFRYHKNKASILSSSSITVFSPVINSRGLHGLNDYWSLVHSKPQVELIYDPLLKILSKSSWHLLSHFLMTRRKVVYYCHIWHGDVQYSLCSLDRISVNCSNNTTSQDYR